MLTSLTESAFSTWLLESESIWGYATATLQRSANVMLRLLMSSSERYSPGLAVGRNRLSAIA